MPTHSGTYRFDSKQFHGMLDICKGYSHRNSPWVAFFHFNEKELAGRVVIGVVTERHGASTHIEALELAKQRGFNRTGTERR